MEDCGYIVNGRPSKCWVWDGALSKDEYGAKSVDGVVYPAHVIGWCWHNRRYVPARMVLDHLCRTRRCIRPQHLEPKSNRENVLIGIGPSAVNSQKTHCPKNHPYDAINTLITPDGRRHCRSCERERSRLTR